MTKHNAIPEACLKQYDLLLDQIEGMERKGKGSPYTSVNGNMYTIMRKDGVLGICLSKKDQESFMTTFDTGPFENYGAFMKDYVEVPARVLMMTETMLDYLKRSHAYALTLKAKPTKGKKQEPKKQPQKVTHLVGETYKNGQLMSELIEDQLVHYYNDGTLKAKGKILNEQMEGKWHFYRKNGQLMQIGHFHADIKDGEWIRYDSKNQIAYHVIFKMGKIIEKMV